jgi:hypothetical protein
MAALLDHVARMTAAADVYLSFTREDYRKAWVLKQLSNLKFVGDVVIDE